MTTEPSPRAIAHRRIYVALLEDARWWSAPYGILEGTHTLKRGGAVRTITFGVSRLLDATVYVWSPTRIVIEGQGGWAHKIVGRFDSVEAAIEHLRANIPGVRHDTED